MLALADSTYLEAVFYMTFIWPIYGAICMCQGALDLIFNSEIGEYYDCLADRMDDFSIMYWELSLICDADLFLIWLKLHKTNTSPLYTSSLRKLWVNYLRERSEFSVWMNDDF